MVNYVHETTHSCPVCHRAQPHVQINHYNHNANPATPWCSVGHRPTTMHLVHNRTSRLIKSEAPMATFSNLNWYPNSSYFLSDDKWPTPTPRKTAEQVFAELDVQVGDRVSPTPTPRKTAEQVFAELDVQVGDRVSLTPRKGTDRASKLEGKVVQIKKKDGKSQLRIAGFEHTGPSVGGQHVFWPVEAYTIEVVERGYRWTDDDRLIVAVAGLNEDVWLDQGAAVRKSYRTSYAPRIAAVKKLLDKA